MIKLVGTLTVTELDKIKSHYVMSSGDLMRIYQNCYNKALMDMASALSDKATAGKLFESDDYGMITEDEVFLMSKKLSKQLTVSNPSMLDCDTDTLLREIEAIKNKGVCSSTICSNCPYDDKCFNGEMGELLMADKIMELIKKYSV